VIAGAPRGEVVVPAPVEAVAQGRAIRPVWQNELGGLTFEVGGPTDRCFIKWAPAGSGLDLAGEVARLKWAAAFTPVPDVLDAGHDADGTWIVTAGIAGTSAVAERWKADPATAVAAVGQGLRAFHDALPVDSCPFSWSLIDRITQAHQRAEAGQLDPTRWDPAHASLSVTRALAILDEVPAIERLVVCHGDACVPNTLLADDGRWSGHVDLGALGVADVWADLAIATWSTGWNYGCGWEQPLLEAYGIDLDEDRTRYYRLLWDLVP
jgi:kanamycin kinase